MNISKLNEQQQAAVISDAKRLLIIAGAGTGKTRTITEKIIHLIADGISPSNILAMTFTNKAAKEMSERIIAGSRTNDGIMIKTFHSFCVYILRRYGSHTDRGSDFVIYDDEDSNKVIARIAKAHNAAMHIKDITKSIELYKQNCENIPISRPYDFAGIYSDYQNALRESKAFDFGDLIFETIKLLQQNENIRDKIRQKYRYILIDEYQDTNQSQFELLQLITGDDTHLTVVGDEDQSIYRFRGADISNILHFQNDFNDVEIVKLVQNYRSTKQILDVADSVIRNNTQRLGKTLTSSADGSKPVFTEYSSEKEESLAIVNAIKQNNLCLNDTAILYRTNAQSRPIESALTAAGIPFTVFGSTPLFNKEEIKDTIAIARWIINPFDKLAFERFVNKPARGIGAKALQQFYTFAENVKGDLAAALQHLSESDNTKLAGLFQPIINILSVIPAEKDKCDIAAILDHIMTELGLCDYYLDDEDGQDRLENIKSFLQFLSAGSGSWTEVLDTIALEPSTKLSSDNGTVKLMTVHNAKGLEFDNVFIIGLSENIFPHANALSGGDAADDLEEERRLFYVAVTRAKRKLVLSHAASRFAFTEYRQYKRSRFIDEIDSELLSVSYAAHAREPNPMNDCLIQVGKMVRHKDYGSGKVISIVPRNGKHLITIDFFDYSYMEFILEFTKLEVQE
ncbi:MAG: ATP-dependent helicase [Spirochaetales bacterium]|nr:ATP-dependent helicase [Spirochaetales bacterium]